jgi:peroxiredoxin
MRHAIESTRLAVAAALAAALAGPLAAQSPDDAAPRASLRRGDEAPDFTVSGPKGEAVRLSDFRGRILIVDVSATWCGPCQAAMPNNDRIYRKYADQGVVLLGVTADDSRAAYDGWIRRNAEKYRFLMTFDPAGRDGWKDSVFDTKYHVTGFPTLFVIGRDGKISEVVSGGGPGDDYRLEYALARAGAKVDLASLPPEPRKDPNAPKSISASLKTMAMPAMGMGGPPAASAPGGSPLAPAKFGGLARGAAMPDLDLVGPDGKPVKSSEVLRGRTALLVFVDSRGPGSYQKDLLAAYGGKGLVILDVFAATPRDAFDAWVAAHPGADGASVAWDPAGKAWAENASNTEFGIGMYPATAVVGKDGRLVGGFVGFGPKSPTMVKALLAEAHDFPLSPADAADVRSAEAAAAP